MKDPFALLGVPAQLHISAAELGAAYLRACARWHPDRAQSPIQRDEFVQRSAEVGEAKARLAQALGRAEALLELRTAAADSAEAAPEVALSPEFLMEAMELRQRIEEAHESHDVAQLQAVTTEVDGERQQCIDEIAAAFSAADVCLPEAREAIARLRYLERMRARIAELVAQ